MFICCFHGSSICKMHFINLLFALRVNTSYLCRFSMSVKQHISNLDIFRCFPSIWSWKRCVQGICLSFTCFLFRNLPIIQCNCTHNLYFIRSQSNTSVCSLANCGVCIRQNLFQRFAVCQSQFKFVCLAFQFTV